MQGLHFPERTEVFYTEFDQHRPIFVILSQIYRFFGFLFYIFDLIVLSNVAQPFLKTIPFGPAERRRCLRSRNTTENIQHGDIAYVRGIV